VVLRVFRGFCFAHVDALCNMMGNVKYDQAMQSSHSQKTEMIRFARAMLSPSRQSPTYSHSGRKEWGQSRLSPNYRP